MERSMTLTLLVVKRSRQIVYAEAGKDFVDLLLSFLTMPIGSVIKLLSASPSKKVGSISNLYESLDKLPSVFMNSEKSLLLDAILDSSSCHKTLSIDYGESKFYVCGYNNNSYTNITHNITNRTGQKCSCGQLLRNEVRFGGVENSSNTVSTSTGSRSSCDYVKETVTFIITDDLTISPTSTIASIALLNRMNIKDISQHEEKSVRGWTPTVTNDINQPVKLLWASLVLISALNDVFSATISSPTKQGSKQKDVG